MVVVGRGLSKGSKYGLAVGGFSGIASMEAEDARPTVDLDSELSEGKDLLEVSGVGVSWDVSGLPILKT